MTTARDELAAIIRPHLSGSGLPSGTIGHMAAEWEAERLADAIIAAGWSSPIIEAPPLS